MNVTELLLENPSVASVKEAVKTVGELTEIEDGTRKATRPVVPTTA